MSRIIEKIEKLQLDLTKSNINSMKMELVNLKSKLNEIEVKKAKLLNRKIYLEKEVERQNKLIYIIGQARKIRGTIKTE
jgi:C1A family cysteine protease